jgi:hypothetical protein
MALFQKSPTKQLAASLDELRSRADRLRAKRDGAAYELEAAKAAQQTFLLGADIDDAKAGGAILDRVSRATAALAGFDSAITAITAQIRESEQQLADEQAKIEREAAAKELRIAVEGIEARIGPLAAPDSRSRQRPREARLGAFRLRRYFQFHEQCSRRDRGGPRCVPD